jgi:hypothetical protein
MMYNSGMNDEEFDLPVLSPAREIFKNDYLKCFNGVRAYKITHPNASDRSAAVCSSRLLMNVDIQAHIRAHLRSAHASVDEVLSQLGETARFDMGAFLDPDTGEIDIFTESIIDGKVIKTTRPETRFIKKLKQRKTTGMDGSVSITTEIELRDPDAAQDKILRVAGAYKDNLNLSVDKITVKLVRDEDGS